MEGRVVDPALHRATNCHANVTARPLCVPAGQCGGQSRQRLTGSRHIGQNGVPSGTRNGSPAR
jgi:hypothetical protein